MNLYSKNRPQLYKIIIEELFTQKNWAHSLEYYSIDMREYQDFIDFINTKKINFSATKYMVFTDLEESNKIYFTFSNNRNSIDLEADISTGNVSFY